MFKIEYKIEIPFTYDASHRGAPYSLDGGLTHKNNGEFTESCIKHHRGLDYMVNPSTTFDSGSDIEELNASVKSSRFTLVNKTLADTFDETVNLYFETVHSTCWIYAVVLEEEVTLYTMNADEFKSFLYAFTALNERNVIRAKATSTKMIKWFEEKVEC